MGASLIHFPEGSLSGYAGIDFSSSADYPWLDLKEATQIVIRRSAELGLLTLLGSAHSLSGLHKPHNSVYLIHPEKHILDRYDKRFCAGDLSESTGDLLHYSPGNHFCAFRWEGMKCGILICHDYRYPELYREYKRLGVQVLFHSFHAGNMSPERKKTMEDQVGSQFHGINPGKTFPEITMPSTLISYAGNNHMWVSASNTSAPESCWPAMVVRPDGVIHGRLDRNQPGILITDIEKNEAYYDSTADWRIRSIQGVYHSGTLVEDQRSDNRQEL